MVVGGSQQETLDPRFVLLGTRQQGVPVILRELVLPGGFDLVSPRFTVRDVTTELSEPMVVGGNQQETLYPGFALLGTRQQGLPVILRELVLPGRSDLLSPSFTFH
ncbi:unnamed protein product [Schistosoma margrebowiei]|uniref:Uncharacterized protein n=1 Tax=Schistosoma margrebowiei TaxID=48269 RepID=A0A183LWK1_9TREM|nr:unnamed protein product [Schistosoma margrebowiei]